MLLDGGVKAVSKVLEAYMGEAALLAKPTWGQKVWLPWALAQRGDIVAKHDWVVVVLL